MARKIPKDSSVAEWSANRYVDSDPDFSLIKTGFLNTPLFLPISNDRRVCLARHKLYADWKYSELFASSQIITELSKPPGRISDGIILTGPANHWHFIIDGLANFGRPLLSRCDHVFVEENISEDQISFLKLYVKSLVGKDIIIDRLAESTYFLRNVFIPTNKPIASKVAAFRSCLDRIEDFPPHPDAKKRIYISRKNAETRQLVNEEDLLLMLKTEFDFHPILNEDYSIIDQLSIYREADIVMGPHGAGLTNILFSKSPSLLAEMFSEVQQPFYPALAQAMGIRYLGFPGTATRPDDDPYRADNAPFRVDVAGIRDALGKLLG